mmetsp:Transcript_44414/g.102632  ORF Transcript_44414/g.102632 Transcript_44414/m.102632 type:complete len:204 (+) Transcript_44414:178-789(+)
MSDVARCWKPAWSGVAMRWGPSGRVREPDRFGVGAPRVRLFRRPGTPIVECMASHKRSHCSWILLMLRIRMNRSCDRALPRSRVMPSRNSNWETRPSPSSRSSKSSTPERTSKPSALIQTLTLGCSRSHSSSFSSRKPSSDLSASLKSAVSLALKALISLVRSLQRSSSSFAVEVSVSFRKRAEMMRIMAKTTPVTYKLKKAA